MQPNRSLIEGRHPSLPNLSAEELANWIRSSAKETFSHEEKDYFSPDEIVDFEHESVLKGREINRVTDIVKEITSLAKKGTDEAVTFTLPKTVGTKALETHRRENDDFVENGYVMRKMDLYGIPNVDSHNMEYFDIEGNEVTERRRSLTAKEKRETLGFFADQKKVGNSLIDDNTGELLSGSGN